jgi:hypothetical protein
MIISNELPPHLQKQVDLGTPGTDILHGELKNLMYATEQEIANLSPSQDVPEYKYLTGQLDAYAEVYQLTYLLAFAIDDRSKNAKI